MLNHSITSHHIIYYLKKVHCYAISLKSFDEKKKKKSINYDGPADNFYYFE